MGEIAETMWNGGSCSWCGIYFKTEPGYPRLCRSCWLEWIKEHGGDKHQIRDMGFEPAQEEDEL